MHRWRHASWVVVLLSGCAAEAVEGQAIEKQMDDEEMGTQVSALSGDYQWAKTAEYGNTGGAVGIHATAAGRITEVGETHRKLLINVLNTDGSAATPPSSVLTFAGMTQISPAALAPQYAATADGNDKLIAVGTASTKVTNCYEDRSNCDDRFFVARINGSSLDPLFIGGGATAIDLAPGVSYESARAVTVNQSTHEIFVAGRIGLTADIARIGLVKLSPGGTTDFYFQKGPKAPISGLYELATGIKLQLDGKIVVVGNNPSGMFVRRFLADGTPDMAFGVSAPGYTRYSGTAWGLYVDGSNRIVVVGGTNADETTAGKAQVLRLTRDGAFDSTFCDTPPSCGDGVTLLDSGQQWQEARAVRLDGQGRIVVSGRARSSGGADYMFLGRVLSSGYEDLTLGPDGTRLYRPTASDAWANSLEVLSSSYLMAGYADKISASDTVNNFVVTLRVAQ